MTTERQAVVPSREEFLKNLSATGLSDVAEAATAGQPPAVATATNGPALAQALVSSGKLTDYQAEAVLAGRLADLRIGNYDVLDRLGAGAMGTVYKARHRRMKRVVALKTLSRTGDQSKKFVARFQREVEMIAKLIHPNIVMAFDADEADVGLFLVMEFVDGRDLMTEVAMHGPLPVVDAVNCTLQTARGLEYAHTHGLIHRDIKPANILRATSGQIKLADLGLARLNEEGRTGATSLTQAGGVVGTIDYMPPEQAVDSTTIDHRADQYSLGCTLYFLLTGAPMYGGSSAMSVLLKHRDAPIPSLCDVRPDTPPELDVVFRKMVAKLPQDRYPNMTEVLRALEVVPLPPVSAAPVVRPTSSSMVDASSPSASSQNSKFDATQSFPGAVKPGPSVAGLAVVLAEASRTQAGIMRKQLELLGITDIRIAQSGAQALELARTAKTQVLMSSMHLSDMTGVQLARVVRTDPALAGVGFVLATSESEKELATDLQGLLKTVLTPKPFELPRLSRALAEASGAATS